MWDITKYYKIFIGSSDLFLSYKFYRNQSLV